MTIAAPTDAWWAILCSLIGRDELIADSRTSTNERRLANADFVYGEVEAFTMPRTRRELMETFGGRLPFGPVYDIADIMGDPHFAARQMLVDVPHPGSDRWFDLQGFPSR